MSFSREPILPLVRSRGKGLKGHRDPLYPGKRDDTERRSENGLLESLT